MAAVSNNLKLFRQRNTESLGRIVACCFPQLELLVVSNRNKYQTGLRRKRESKKQQGRGERGNPKESVGLMTRAARRQLSLQVWCVLGQDDTVRTHFSFVLSHVFSVLAWLSDRLFPSSAPYKLCGDLHPPSFQSNKKKKKKKEEREGGRKRSFLVVPTEIHKLSLIALARFMWPVTARIQKPPLGQFWVISFITPGAIWTSRRGMWASEVLPNLILFIYSHCSNVFLLSPGLPPYHSCFNSAFGQIIPK